MRWLVPLLLCICVTNCSTTPWPKEGTGGYATVHGLESEQITEMEEKIELYGKCEAKRFAAIEFREAEVLIVYLKRSHAAEDFTFAQREYTRLEVLSDLIEKRLPNKACFKPQKPVEPKAQNKKPMQIVKP